MKYNINDCKILNLPEFRNDAGNLVYVQNNLQFKTKRVYYLYDIPSGFNRGGHAHKNLFQIIICISGSFKINLFDGKDYKSYVFSKPNEGLYIVPGIWRELKDFSSNSVCLVLASEQYDPSDYINSLEEFDNYASKNNKLIND